MMNLSEDDDKKIRDSIVDGIFYPAAEEELKNVTTGLLEDEKEFSDESFAIITPHAAFDYAGNIIAAAFQSAAKRKIKTVVILAPEHRKDRNEIILPESDYFKIPLGLIPINHEIVDELLSCSNLIIKNDVPHLEEHCIEIQLPFIKTIFPDSDIVPIIMSKSKPRNIKLLANALQLIFSDKFDETLFVISANIAYSDKNHNTADKHAEYFIHLLKDKNISGINESLSKKEISTCGADCISTILAFKNMNYKIDILKQNNSREIDPSSKTTVHYAAVSIKNG